MKGLISLIIAGAMVLSGNGAASLNYKVVKENVSIVVNGYTLALDNQVVSVNGRTLAPAEAVFEKLNARVEQQDSSVNIAIGGTVVTMRVGDRVYKVNDEAKVMDTVPLLVKGTIMVPLRYVAEALKCPLVWIGARNTIYLGDSRLPVPGQIRKRVVVIDPGHGGSETGAIADGVDEKVFNLDIAKRLNTLLREQGIVTFMTREDDSYVDLYDRTTLSNGIDADLFVSIHNNAWYSQTQGSMTLYYPDDARARGNLTPKTLAQIVQNEMIKKLGTKDLGIVERPGLAVLRTSNIPAIIAEVAFMTNSDDMSRLKTATFRQDAAEALKNAVLAALNKI